jgi:hypothetical protein
VGELAGGEQAHGMRLAAGVDRDLREHGGRIDLLIEQREHRRVELLRRAFGVVRDQHRRPGLELELDRLGELAAGGAGRAGGDLDAVGRGLRKANLGVEHDGARADPAPRTLGLRRQLDRRGRRGIALRGDRDHRLVEGDGELGRQWHTALGHVAQHAELAAGRDRGWRQLRRGRRGKRALDRLAGARRRLRPRAQRECLLIGRVGGDRLEPLQQGGGVGVGQLLGRRELGAIERRRSGLAVRQREIEPGWNVLALHERLIRRPRAAAGGPAGAGAATAARRDHGEQRRDREAASR